MFSKHITSEVIFEATPEQAWAVLSDFAAYGEWNPGFPSVVGRAEVGAKLDVKFSLSGGRTMTMHPKVLVADSPRELRWLGHLLVPYVFDGEHRFQIEEVEPGRVRLVQSERFRGLLVPFARKMIEVSTAATFAEVNDAFARRVGERRDAA